MAATEPRAPHAPLDEAHGYRLAGDADAALRWGLALLESADHPLGAAALLASVLIGEGRTIVAGEVAHRLVDGWVRRGDLPQATAAAHLLDRAGEDGPAARRRIAEAFAGGSARLDDVSPTPPPLPPVREVPARLARLRGAPLRDGAEDALQGFLAQEDPVDAAAAVPRLPLFSALPADALARLLDAMEVRDVPAGDEVIVQGEEGREAFVVVRGLLEVRRRADPGAEAAILATLGPGAIFGEMALVSAAPRAATVAAVQPAQVLCIARATLEALAREQAAIGRELGHFCRGRMVRNLVSHSPVLRRVAPAQRAELIGRFEAVTFESGEKLVVLGDEPSGLYLIASGGVEVVGRDADGDAVRLAEVGPGDVVGEISLVLRRPANADVVARHPTVALRLSRDRFQQAIADHPGLLNELYELATKREEETSSVVAQRALEVDDAVLV
ncbi:MAG: cyclic nucleotide-binding domain-containing protein [Myxococcota bacterium]